MPYDLLMSSATRGTVAVICSARHQTGKTVDYLETGNRSTGEKWRLQGHSNLRRQLHQPV